MKKINRLERPHSLNCIYAMEIVYDAYTKGFINWNICNKAIEKIKTNMNGSWMFEQQQKEDEKWVL
jgi:uncharacterized protein (DUF2225 family)